MAGVIDVERIPAAIRALERWVVWREEDVGRPKLTKVPYRPTGSAYTAKADSTDPTTWGTLEAALVCIASYERGAGQPQGWRHGIGFVLGDGFSGVDLDSCVDPLTGDVEQWAMEIVTELDSYTEISPSGTGLHILLRGNLPPGRRRKGKIEMYSEARYFTVTGNRLLDELVEIENRSHALAQLHVRIFPPQTNGAGPPLPPQPIDLDDHELIERAFAAGNGAKFSRLWNGDIGDYEGDHSAADLALCNDLAFWCQKDAGRMDRLFRSSGLMRRKWDERRGEQTYGQLTIGRAIEGCRETYTPRAPRVQPSSPPSPPRDDEYDRLEREAIQAEAEPPPGAEALALPTWRTLADIDDSPPGELICGMLEPDGPTLIYGRGGVGKGMTCAWLIGECLKLGMRPLIYDAEAHPREWRRRTAGLGIDPSEVVYVEPRDLPKDLLGMPLHKIVPYLGKIAQAAGCGILIVDSILAAANLSEEGLKSDAAAPYHYASALGELGIPSVSLGHTSKNNAQGEPYGSVSWTNAMRLTWMGTRAEGGGHSVRWTPRKRNERGEIPALRLSFRYDAAGRLCEVVREDAERVTRDLLVSMLMEGERTVEELAEELVDADSDRDGSYGDAIAQAKDLVRRTLGRMRRAGLAHKKGGRGAPWALGKPGRVSRKDLED